MPRQNQKARLDRAGIVATAIALADEEGIEQLSMRNVARRLGTGAMSLYNHVADKDALERAMVDDITAEIDEPPADLDPLQAIRAMALEMRLVLLAHPWAPALWLRHLPGPNRARGMEVLLRLFAETDLSPDLAHLGFHAVNNHVIGYTMQERAMRDARDDPEAAAHAYYELIDDGEHPHSLEHVRQHLDGETSSSFEAVLDIILDGLVRLDRNPDRAPIS